VTAARAKGGRVTAGRAMTGRATTLAIVALVSAIAGSARAQSKCPAIEGGANALADADAEARLAFVRATMRDQASRAKTWTWTWSGIGFGLAAGQYSLMAIVPANKRFQQAFEGTAALYLPASLAVMPLRVRADDETLERFLADTEVTGPDGQTHGMAPCVRLARAEELLVSSAEDESLHTNWFQHTLTIVLSGAYAAVLGVAFKNVADVIVNGGGALVLGELQLLTSPTGAASALERYRRGDIGAAPAAPARVSWALAPLGAAPGVSLVGRF
jgi:hypothetical protein